VRPEGVEATLESPYPLFDRTKAVAGELERLEKARLRVAPFLDLDLLR
jgi:hypothetical protein